MEFSDGVFEDADETLSYIKGGKLPNDLGDCQVLIKNLKAKRSLRENSVIKRI
jgi:hypothetical protein